MDEKPNLTLPGREKKVEKRSSRGLLVLNIVVLTAVCANIAVALVRSERANSGAVGAGGPSLPVESMKQLALKLEKQGLNDASIAAWKEYMDASRPDEEAAAKIWYRIGKLYQDSDRYEEAVDSYYRSESHHRIDDLGPEIARRVQECLESMGKYAALRYELADRVGMVSSSSEGETGETGGGQIVAEIGAQKISQAELDRRIERNIDRQLSQFASYLPEEERRKQKEQLLKQFSSNAQRQVFLNQFILEEILYRRALETDLADDPDVRGMLRDQERAILAGMLIEKELADKIKISPVDIETYYEAHKESFVVPERAVIAHILVKSARDAKSARRRLESGLDFGDLAKELSLDAATREEGGRIPGWVERGAKTIPGVGESDDAMEAIFTTQKGKLAKQDVVTDQGIHIIKVLEHEAKRQKTFDEAKNDVFRQFRSQKENDVRQNLLSGLEDHYDVVIHRSAFSEEGGETGNAASGNTSPGIR